MSAPRLDSKVEPKHLGFLRHIHTSGTQYGSTDDDQAGTLASSMNL